MSVRTGHDSDGDIGRGTDGDVGRGIDDIDGDIGRGVVPRGPAWQAWPVTLTNGAPTEPGRQGAPGRDPLETPRSSGAAGVTVRYWAAARAAAGTAEERLPGGTVDELLAAAEAAHPALTPVLAVASVLVDGVAAERSATVGGDSLVEILPPFAGG